MLQDVILRLKSFGYEFDENDTYTLNFIIQKTENLIKDTCGAEEIPERLRCAEVDMVTAEFLEEKKATEPESLTSINLEAAVKSIQEGDTTVTYAVDAGTLTPERRFDMVIDMLKNSGRAVFSAHRCVVW